jgi:glyoxylase-like metal-dependent hydrolase (beta-lactamase superfamily II)
MIDPRVLMLKIPNLSVEGRNRIYVIAADPVTMIDTGIATRKAFDAIVDGLREHKLALHDVRRIILTHKHIDHIGNAWRIQRESDAEILIHESELPAVTDVDPHGARFADLVRQRRSEWGAPAEAAAQNDAARPNWEIESARARGFTDGEHIPIDGGALEVIHTPGHTMGSVCLKFGRVLFSGDHVLPGISPNVGGGDMRSRNLLRHYTDSLKRITQFSTEVDEVLPGHGDPFSDLQARCAELLAHHDERLERVRAILADRGEQSVYEVACVLFGPMENYHVVLGCAEAAAHLEYLEDAGQVKSHSGRFSLA